jgi:hypothetical protein
MAIHRRHLKLVLEVGDRAQTADDHARAGPPRVVDEQPVEAVDADLLAEGRRDLADHLDPLVHGEQPARLLVIVGDGDHDLVDEPEGATKDVEVAVRDGIERAGIHGAAFVHVVSARWFR